MKKYLVIGNPIEHSLSPKLHNYWFEKNNIDANYDKRKIDKSEIQEIINKIKDNKLDGINVTVPFKTDVILFLDTLSEEAQITQSVNTIYMHDKKLVGHNTDIKGFELSLKNTQFDLNNKSIFILGAGGVVPSIIYALEKLGVSKITVSNRTKQKAQNLKKRFSGYKFYLIMGADNLINFHKWKHWREISTKCTILVFDRKGYKSRSLKSKSYKKLGKKVINFIKFNKVNISSSQLRKI